MVRMVPFGTGLRSALPLVKPDREGSASFGLRVLSLPWQKL